jgi:type IV secretory pathway VirB2 component (pilin)
MNQNLVKSFIFYIFSILVISFLLPKLAFAAESTNAISDTLCNIIKQLKGPIGKGIATIAVIVLGIGLFLGKLSWPLFIATAIGIGLIFGAPTIVDWVGGTTGTASACP